MARLSTQQPKQRHETPCHRVHPPLPAPCPASGFRKNPTLRTACQPQPSTHSRLVPHPSPGHSRRSHHASQPTAEVCTEPILPPVPMRNPARHHPLFRRTAYPTHSRASPCNCRLLLKETMLRLTPTRLVAPADSPPAGAELCVEPAPPTSTGPPQKPCRIADCSPHVSLRCVPPTTHHLGLPQILFNPHTSTALAA